MDFKLLGSSVAGDTRRACRQSLYCLALVVAFPSWLAAAQAPIVDSFTATSATVAPGGAITLTVLAHDPDCADICTSGCGTYIRSDLTLWSATGGSLSNADNGVNSSPYTATVDWQAPLTEDLYTLTVSLSDSGTFMCGNRQTVTADLVIQVTSSPNQAPEIESVTASPTQLFPDQQSTLSSVASDPDGDPLTYSWSADSGSITGASNASATFTAGPPGIVTVTCRVTDTGGAVLAKSIKLSVTDAIAESIISDGLVAPRRLSIDSMGDIYVVDGAQLTVVNLFSGKLVYRLLVPGITSVAVDWQDNLLVGGKTRAWVLDRRGGALMSLDPGEPLGRVSDVAVDVANHCYAVLHRSTGRVVVYDAAGAKLAAFGSTGNGAGELSRPQGIGITPAGQIVVADSGHGMIKIFNLDGTLATTFGNTGSAAGEFIRLDDVAVSATGFIYATDTYQDWVQVFHPDGTLKEVLGTYGEEVGQLKTPTGVLPADAFSKLVVASLNASRLVVFAMDGMTPVAPEPKASLSASTLAFDAREVGTSSGPKTVTLTNSGSAPLGIRDVEVNGDFAQSDDCIPFIDPGGSCTFNVTFSPRSAGSLSGWMKIDTSADPELLTVSLTGEGFAAAGILLSPEHLIFSDQGLGSVSDPETVIATNSGTVPLTLTSILVSDEFGFVSSCPALLAGGATCSIDVYFNPQTTNDHISGTLAVGTSVGTDTVALDGSGVSWDLSIVPETQTLTFARRAATTVSQPQPVSITNSGSELIVIDGIELEGVDISSFRLDQDGCSGLHLWGGQTCNMAASFRPSQEGTFSASIRINSNATASPHLISLQAEAGGANLIFYDGFESGDLSAWSVVFPSPRAVLRLNEGVSASPLTLSFGEQPVRTMSACGTITVVNAGTEAIQIGPVTVTDEAFRLEEDPCSGAVLAEGDNCTILIGFRPAFQGVYSAEIRIPHSAPDHPGAVALSGVGARTRDRRRR